MIVVNYKTYDQSSGLQAINLTRALQEVARDFTTPVIVSPATVDIERVAQQSRLAVWAQHIDVFEEGQSTGWFPAETAREIGVQGTLLNHSEHKLDKQVLETTVKRCKEIGLQTLIFAASQEEAEEVAAFEPDYIGYEPPELVGSQTTSVAEAKPEIIQQVVEKVSNVPILVGAGIKSAEDVKVSLQLGAKGIAISSAIVLSEKPGDKLRELLEGFNQ